MNKNATNKQIAKNTMFLYTRMIVLIGITFYTSRIVLEALGIDDFGIYNIVGGIVVLFSFLNTAMTNASQRFISYALGRADENNIKRVFCTSINCHIIVSLILLIIAETIGLWIVHHILNIPKESLSAALIVYQCCIFTSLVSVIQVPYSATIISFENMKFYSYISIVESLLKLIIVFVILYSSSNRLIEYAILNLIISIIIFFFYILYVYHKFHSCRYTFIWDTALFKSIMSFSGWSMLSGSSVIISQQGGNILLNYFFGVAVNAAYGIGSQVSSAINGFVTNFQIAFKPRIVKLYANNQIHEESNLINSSSKFSVYLMMLVFIPFIINGEWILSIWLKQVPQYTYLFCIWILIYLSIDAIQAPIWTAIYATGEIKKYTIGSCFFTLINLPVAYLFLFLGFSPVYVLVIRAFFNFFFSIFRLWTLHHLIGYDIMPYLNICFKQVAPCILTALVLSYFCKIIFPDNLSGFIMVTLLSVFIVLSTVFTVGLNKAERMYIIIIIKNKLFHR